MVTKQLREGARAATALLKPMANENRLMILCLLLDGERSVGDMTAELGLAQSSLSQHLARLRLEGLVTTRREGQNVFYSLRKGHNRLLEAVKGIYCVGSDGLAASC